MLTVLIFISGVFSSCLSQFWTRNILSEEKFMFIYNDKLLSYVMFIWRIFTLGLVGSVLAKESGFSDVSNMVTGALKVLISMFHCLLFSCIPKRRLRGLVTPCVYDAVWKNGVMVISLDRLYLGNWNKKNLLSQWASPAMIHLWPRLVSDLSTYWRG